MLAAAVLLLAALPLALGVWQLQRRVWKHALIAQVEARLAAAPQPAPGPADWPRLSADDHYRRVVIEGRYDPGRETCTQAVTIHGPGCWLMVPLTTADGWTVLVNRGYLAPARRDPATRPASQRHDPVQVRGLLRLSEPGGGFLRRNDPAAERWYSRDVAAISARRGLDPARTAPYFIDADASPDADPATSGGPIGGLTVVRFRDDHLIYALTWFALAGMFIAAAVLLWRQPSNVDTDTDTDTDAEG